MLEDSLDSVVVIPTSSGGINNVCIMRLGLGRFMRRKSDTVSASDSMNATPAPMTKVDPMRIAVWDISTEALHSLCATVASLPRGGQGLHDVPTPV